MIHVPCRSDYAHIPFFLKIDSSVADIADGEEWIPAPAFPRFHEGRREGMLSRE
jgi:hypothetical protein